MANPGKKLFFSKFGGEQPIPPEFIAAMERAEERQALGENTTGPEALSDTIVESRVETDRTNERVRVTIKKKSGNITLNAINTNDQGQPVQVVRTLYPTGTTPTEPTATTEVAVQDLGNGWSIQEVATEGSYIDGVFTPGVFGNELRGISKEDNIPAKFKASIPTTTNRIDSDGTIATPSLTGDEISETQEQLTEFKKRVTVEEQAIPELPVTLLGKEMTSAADGEVVTVSESLLLAAAAAATLNYLTTEYSRENIGDGNAIETIKTAPSYPVRTSYEYDARLRDYIAIEKQFVDGTLVTPPVSTADGETTEYQADPTNKYRSIQIVKRIPTDVLSKTIVRNITTTHTFPDEISYLDWIGVSANVGSDYRLEYGLDLDMRNGPSGTFAARLTETFTLNPAESLPSIFHYKLVSGTISIAFVYGVLALLNGAPQFAADARTFSIPASLHGDLDPTPPFIGAALDISTSGLEASNPSTLNTGAWIVKDVAMEDWRCGLFVKSVLEVLVPSNDPS